VFEVFAADIFGSTRGVANQMDLLLEFPSAVEEVFVTITAVETLSRIEAAIEPQVTILSTGLEFVVFFQSIVFNC
jgi:hypothetical protein